MLQPMIHHEDGSETVVCHPDHLPEVCRLALELIPIQPRRMQLQTHGVEATIPMLRGAWGKAMHDRCPELYGVVFDVGSSPGAVAQSPPYVVRAAPPDPEWAPAMESILIGPAVGFTAELDQCWLVASRAGLGKERRPFEIVRTETMRPDQSTSSDCEPWSLSR